MNKSKYVIVVGIDYSTSSERALDEALELARSKHGVHLHVANVRPTFAPQTEPKAAASALPPWRYWATELRDYVARKVAAFEASVGVAPLKHVHTHQRMSDDVAHELAQLAADLEADLMVVGTHDWHGAAQLSLGSVADATARVSPCPVLVVRRKTVPSASAIRPPCAECVQSRQASGDTNLWCERHAGQHDCFNRLND